jgi:mevalonate kinase
MIPKDPTKKTGLGSSAALIVSFLASTLSYLGIIKAEELAKREQ